MPRRAINCRRFVFWWERCLYFIACIGIANRALFPLSLLYHRQFQSCRKLWQACPTPVARKCVFFASLNCRSQLGHSTLFVASLVFMKGTSFCVIGRSRVHPLKKIVLWQIFIGLHWFPLLSACRLVEFDTCVICHVFTPFRLISFATYAWKSPRICFWGTKYEF